ncbi:MAG: DASS family sodium-coupled anion symporter [Phycisphaeraceae bacterium]|nr:DASS family sodium-coupled anion symporter [Phycisphaeraceae bacterium]
MTAPATGDATPAISPSRLAALGNLGLVAGPLLAAAVYWFLPPLPTGLSHEARSTAALGVLMAIWWMTEAIPLSATSLLPIIALPLLRVTPVGAAAAPYADPLIFLFLGGFILGLGMQRWGLHRRLALLTILTVGGNPRRTVLGFMVATAMLSMWVNNSATAMMMMPIGLSVIALVSARLGRGDLSNPDAEGLPGRNFATCIMLGIAYSASIGGVGTLIGTPPNLVFASQARAIFGQEIGFLRWMWLGVPIVMILIPVVWIYLTFLAFPVRIQSIPGSRSMLRDEFKRLGPMSRGEIAVMVVFFIAAACWITRPLLTARGLPMLHDSVIAVAAAAVLFLIPIDLRARRFVMDWETAEKLPWGVLLLFGGGLSLASALTATGVDAFIGHSLARMDGVPDLVLVAAVAAAILFLTEIASNTAIATVMMPVLAGAAAGLGVHPYLLMIPGCLAASLAFMMPVGTPPNAIVFSTGRVTMRQMVRAGFWLNLVSILVVTVVVYYAGSWLLGMDLHTVPPWARLPG